MHRGVYSLAQERVEINYKLIDLMLYVYFTAGFVVTIGIDENKTEHIRNRGTSTVRLLFVESNGS